MNKIRLFKTTRRTARFNANQKVWILKRRDSYYEIRFKYRGKGRYVGGRIDVCSKIIGDVREIEVSEEFIHRLYGWGPTNDDE